MFISKNYILSIKWFRTFFQTTMMFNCIRLEKRNFKLTIISENNLKDNVMNLIYKKSNIL